MSTWKVDGMYYINNFPSDYLVGTVEDGNVFCAGEIDPGLALSAEDTVDEVQVAEIDTKTALFGKWKKEAVQDIDPAEYVSVLWNLSRKGSFLLHRSDESKQEELFSTLKIFLKRRRLGDILEGETRQSFQMKLNEIYNDSRKELPEDVSKELKDPESMSEDFGDELPYAFIDNGAISNLDYIVDNYQEVRENIDKVNIMEGDALETLADFPDEHFDYISLNNILDYHDWKEDGYVGEVFELVNDKLKEGGKLILTSKYCRERDSGSQFHCYEDEDGVLRPFDGENDEYDYYGDEEIYLDSVLEEIGFQMSDLELECSDRKVEIPSILELTELMGSSRSCKMAIEVYEKVIEDGK